LTASRQKETRNGGYGFNHASKVNQETLSQIWDSGSNRLCRGAHQLVHLHQSRYFSEEIRCIEDKGSLALSSKFAKLGPVIVPHRGLRLGPSQTPIQILQLGGRIHQADHLAD
jgi:hypothetical protein